MRGPKGTTALFISSSDRTRDVFERVFAPFDRLWPDCPYPRFVGLTSPGPDLLGFQVIGARNGDRGWRAELIEQIQALPPETTHVLLMLDDFMLTGPVDTRRVEQAVEGAKLRNAAYLRLKAVRRSLPLKVAETVLNLAAGRFIHRLSRWEPYYTSLQAAVWRRDYLVYCLSRPGSIWDFEHLVSDEAHYAVTRSVLPYWHVVEKGVWRAYAPLMFSRTGLDFDPGARPLRPRKDLYFFAWELGKFALIGQGWLQARRAINYLKGGLSRRR